MTRHATRSKTTSGRGRRWTTKTRSEALVALENMGKLRTNGYELVKGHYNLNQVEGTLHELAHAVCLGFQKIDRDLTDRVSKAIIKILKQSDYRWIWQEIMTLAAESLVLQELRMPCHRAIVFASAERDSIYTPRQFDAHVRRALTWKSTKQRARLIRRWLDQLCEEGRRGQVA